MNVRETILNYIGNTTQDKVHVIFPTDRELDTTLNNISIDMIQLYIQTGKHVLLVTDGKKYIRIGDENEKIN